MERSSLFWSGWHRSPLLRFALPFAIGLWIGALVSLSTTILLVLAGLALVLVAIPSFILFPYRYRWLPYAAAVPALLIAGVCWWAFRAESTGPPVGADDTHLVEVEVVHGASAR